MTDRDARDRTGPPGGRDGGFTHHTVRYRLDVEEVVVTAALDRMFGPAVDGQWTWAEDQGPLLVHGYLWLDGGHLLAVTNTDQRQEELDEALRDVFGDALQLELGTTESLDELGDRLRAAGVLPPVDSDGDDDGEQPPRP